MRCKIPVTHVGSLPRDKQTTEFLFARERGESYDQHAFRSHMQHAVCDVVAKQVDVGVDIVSDGEMSKISYATYIKDRYHGFGGDSPRNPPADLQMYPGFLQKLATSGGTPSYTRPQCIAQISAKDNHDLADDIVHLTSAMNTHGITQGFMNAASPGVISLFLPNVYYATREKYLQALADVMAQEYKTITDAGLLLQIDCPDLALSRHMLFSECSDEEFIRIAQLHVDILNYALEKVPQDKIRIHICWGNYEGPHCCDIGMDKVLSLCMRIKSRYLLFETANPRHGHEWEVFAHNKDRIADDKVLVPGVIDTTTNFIEHPRLVAQRLTRFVDIVGRERVYAGTDCGFGTFAGFGAVDPDIAYAKIASLAQGAAIV